MYLVTNLYDMWILNIEKMCKNICMYIVKNEKMISNIEYELMLFLLHVKIINLHNIQLARLANLSSVPL